MNTRVKTKGANMAVPQSREDAARTLYLIGKANRLVSRIEHDMNDEISRIKEQAQRKAASAQEQVKELTEGLRIWCEANRAELTGGGKVKSADLGTGKVSWRIAPPSVSIRKMADVIEKLKSLGFQRFLRVKEEVNKEAMLAEPDVASTVKGVTIVSGVEDFAVEPFEDEIAGGQP